MNGTLYALCGFIGSGKTTFAKRLEIEKQAFRLNSDEVMALFFGANSETRLFEERHSKVMELQLRYAERLLKIGTNVILDRGLWSRAARQEIRDFAARIGCPLHMYYISAPDDVMRQRAALRSERMDNMSVLTTPEIWNTLYPKFQPPTPDEYDELIDNS